MSELDFAKLKDLIHNTDTDDENSMASFVEATSEVLGVQHWKSEAQKAFKDRDQAKSERKHFEKLVNEKLAVIEQNKKGSDIKSSKLLEYQIVTESQKCKAYSPLQVYRILRDDFEQDETGNFFVAVKDQNGNVISKKTVEQHTSEFLKMEVNDNLIESDSFKPVFSNNNSGYTGKKGSGRKKYDEKIVKEASSRGLSPEDWISILKQKEEIKRKRSK